MSTVTEQWILGRAKTYELLCDEEVNSQVEESEEHQMSESEVLQEDDNLVSIDIEEFLEDNEVCALEASVEVSGKIVRKADAAREILKREL